MGLDCHAKGLPESECFHGSYYRYHRFIYELIKTAYGEWFAEKWHTCAWDNRSVSAWNRICNQDLDILIFHSDCDGKFTPLECRKIYKALEPFTIDHESYVAGYPARRPLKVVNTLALFKGMFLHCWKRRVNLYYG